MTNYTVNGQEFYHHGIKGMKWGKRRFQNTDGSLTPAGKKRYGDDKWGNAKHQPSSVRSGALAGAYAATGSKRLGRALDKSNAKDAERWERAKANVKATKSAVKSYNKKFEDWNKSQEAADKKWGEVSENYKALGKTRVTRILNAARNKSDAAKAYNKSYNSWERTQNMADKKWTEVSEEYKKTGRNRVNRIVNNIRYG